LLASFVSDGRHRSTLIHLFALLQPPFRGGAVIDGVGDTSAEFG
jgi:hypothetical protein